MKVRARIHGSEDVAYAGSLGSAGGVPGREDSELEGADVVGIVYGVRVVEGEIEEESVCSGFVFEGCVEGDGGVWDSYTGGRRRVLEEYEVSG
jgi:hypothetical protein